MSAVVSSGFVTLLTTEGETEFAFVHGDRLTEVHPLRLPCGH